jgi:hypothetical protein
MHNEQDALDALRAGDFDRAAALLKEIVKENRYASPVLNNAYTLAPHKAGRQLELATASRKLEIGHGTGTRLQRWTTFNPPFSMDCPLNRFEKSESGTKAGLHIDIFQMHRAPKSLSGMLAHGPAIAGTYFFKSCRTRTNPPRIRTRDPIT